MNTDTHHMLSRLERAGVSADDALALRRIAMTLHRWYERECGDQYGNAIERDEKTGRPYLTYGLSNKRGRRSIPDRETGALRRLQRIMADYPTLSAYIQTDPRGASLYILRPGDVPDGEDANAYYSYGIPVHK